MTIDNKGNVTPGDDEEFLCTACGKRYDRFDEVRDATAAIPAELDVLLCHAPPLGFLDNCPGGHIGNPYLMRRLLGMLKPPRAVLCGHVHEEGGGTMEYQGIQIYNGATKVRVIDL